MVLLFFELDFEGEADTVGSGLDAADKIFVSGLHHQLLLQTQRRVKPQQKYLKYNLN